MSSLAVLNVTSLLDSTEFYGINFLAGYSGNGKASADDL